MQTGLSANTPYRIILDAGAFYRNYGETNQSLIGATRGGGTFTVEKEDRMPELDGIRGPVKGLRRSIRHAARLEFTLMEVSRETLIELTRGTVQAETNHFKIVPSHTIALGDYLTNVAFVGDVMNSEYPIILKLLNALAVGEWALSTDDQNEGEIGVRYEAHYDTTDLGGMNNVPYEIWLPKTAS